MPQYYYAVAGMVVLVAMLLIMRAQKAKATKVDEPTDIREGWLATGDMSAPNTAWMATDNETKRQTRARVGAEKKAAATAAKAAQAAAKEAAKAAGKPAKTGKPKGHRRSQHGAAPELVDVAPIEQGPSLVSQDGWLTTVPDAPVHDGAAVPLAAEPQQPVRDLFQAPASAIPQQFAPVAEAPQYAMAGAPVPHAEAVMEAPRGPVVPAATSFTDIMGAPPAGPAAPQPVVPELPVGPYTYGARTIVPGK